MNKILCLCDAGEVRSVAMAKVLRERGHFAVAGSYDNYVNYAIEVTETKNFIPLTFEYILFMQEGGEHFIGRDEWGDIDNPELIKRCKELATRLGL